MANGHGGARIGAGGKKKPLAEKILDGNPGKRKLEVVEFSNLPDLLGEDMPPPREFLYAQQRAGKDLIAVDVYEKTWRWLYERGCANLIPAQILEQYAMSVSRWVQCEDAISTFGLLSKHPTTGNAIQSPYVAMGQSYLRQANTIWYQIFQVVRENCAQEFKGSTPHDDMMERLLSGK